MTKVPHKHFSHNFLIIINLQFLPELSLLSGECKLINYRKSDCELDFQSLKKTMSNSLYV